MSLRQSHALRKSRAPKTVYMLEEPDRRLWDDVMDRLETHRGGRFAARRAANFRYTEEVYEKGIAGVDWDDRDICVQPDDRQPPLSWDEALGLLERVSQYTTGGLSAGVMISYSAWNAFQGLLGKGELRRRDYGPALDALFRARLLKPTGESIRDRADLEIRWPLVVTAEAVRECRRARRRLTSRFWYPIKKWVSQVLVFSVLVILFFLTPGPSARGVFLDDGNGQALSGGSTFGLRRLAVRPGPTPVHGRQRHQRLDPIGLVSDLRPGDLERSSSPSSSSRRNSTCRRGSQLARSGLVGDPWPGRVARVATSRRVAPSLIRREEVRYGSCPSLPGSPTMLQWAVTRHSQGLPRGTLRPQRPPYPTPLLLQKVRRCP